MDAFDFTDSNSRKTNFGSGMIWKLGASLFLLSTVCLLLFFLYTFVNPYNSLNPFPPPTPSSTADALIPTNTLIPVPATPTNTAEIISPVPATTEAPPPTAGGTPGATPGLPSQTPLTTADITPPTQEPGGGLHFIVSGQPTFTTHVDGCNGAYIAGNVTNIGGNPMTSMIVKIGGTLNGAPLSDEASSGDAPNYSSSGWEFKIADTPVKTTAAIFVQLFSQQDEAVSEVIIINTSDLCSENVTLVNFIQDQ